MKKITVTPDSERGNSYQNRIVSYEKIHSIDEKDSDALVSIVNPKNKQTILDACCGYGAVSGWLQGPIAKGGLDTMIVLLDNSDVQLQKAQDCLKGQNLKFVLSDATLTPFPDNHFDTIVNKMGLHEVSEKSQEQMLKEFYRIIKPGGKIVIWDLALGEKTQPLFSRIIKKKDELAGFDSLVRHRHFPMRDEVISLFKNAGFEDANIEHNISYNFSVRNRQEELVSADRLEILGNKGFIEATDEEELEKIAEQKIAELRDYIRDNLSEEEKLLMNYSEKEDDTNLVVPKAIFKAVKPLQNN